MPLPTVLVPRPRVPDAPVRAADPIGRTPAAMVETGVIPPRRPPVRLPESPLAARPPTRPALPVIPAPAPIELAGAVAPDVTPGRAVPPGTPEPGPVSDHELCAFPPG